MFRRSVSVGALLRPLRTLLIGLSCWLVPAVAAQPGVPLVMERVPEGGLQPRVAVGDDGIVHLVYFKGEPAAGDLFYVRRTPGSPSFGEPIRVNDQPGTAIATGTIRGAQIALGPDGRMHVVWNGSAEAPAGPQGSPLLYTRLRSDGQGFEPARNLIQWAGHLDGGGALVVDRRNRVYAFWHADPEAVGEAGRAVYLAVSDDGGRSFGREARISPSGLGACGCCGMQAIATAEGRVIVLYRGARDGMHRDMVALTSEDGDTFDARILDPWELQACPMSSAALATSGDVVVGAWQTDEQLFLTRLDTPSLTMPLAFPGVGPQRKHPSVAVGPTDQLLLAFTEGTSWAQGGSVVWQVVNLDGVPLTKRERRSDLPAWSFPAAYVDDAGRFHVLY